MMRDEREIQKQNGGSGDAVLACCVRKLPTKSTYLGKILFILEYRRYDSRIVLYAFLRRIGKNYWACVI